MYTLGFLGSLGFWEILLLAILGLLIFGRRLTEVGKNLGKGIVEFKKGLAGVEDDVDKAAAAKSPKALESEASAADLAAENARLREQLKAAQKTSGA